MEVNLKLWKLLIAKVLIAQGADWRFSLNITTVNYFQIYKEKFSLLFPLKAFEKKNFCSLVIHFAMQILIFQFCKSHIPMRNSILNIKVRIEFSRPALSFRDISDFLKKNLILQLKFAIRKFPQGLMSTLPEILNVHILMNQNQKKN